jgi:uncharacterized membrane protein (UPF0127 family)
MIRNITKQITIAETEKICRSFFSKLKGLMFTAKCRVPLIFVNKKNEKTAIHMLFVFYPIDIAWLDENKKIVKIETLYPFRFSHGAAARYIIETPAGKMQSNVGDTLEFEA